MANELEILTENDAGNGWVDVVPGKVSTGYQAQNTTIQAGYLGMDRSFIEVVNDEIIARISGPIDDNGTLFSIKSDITLTPPPIIGIYYIRVIAGNSWNKRSLEISPDVPSFNSAKNALYDASGHRVLNWKIQNYGSESLLFKIDPLEMTFSMGLSSEYPTGFTKWEDILPFLWSFKTQNDRTINSIGWAKALAMDLSTMNLICAETLHNHSNIVTVLNGLGPSVVSSFSFNKDIGDICVDSLSNNLIFSERTDKIYNKDEYNSSNIHICNGISNSINQTISFPNKDIVGVFVQNSTGNLVTMDRKAGEVNIHNGLSDSILQIYSANGIVGSSSMCEDISTGKIVMGANGLTIIDPSDGAIRIIGVQNLGAGIYINPQNGQLISSTYQTISINGPF